MKKAEENSLTEFAADFAAGGIAAAVAKTFTAPIERVRLLIQTQDANALIKSGKVPRYTGIINCFTRVYSEQGLAAFWRGNFTNILRYFPTQAFNFAFKDQVKALFPRYRPKQEFGKSLLVNMASGGLAGAGSLCIVYPLDYARTRLSVDVGSEQRAFNGLWDCLVKTVQGPQGMRGLYNGFTISVIGILPYRGIYFGMYDSLAGINPHRADSDLRGLAVKFVIAQTTTITAGYASYPFDTIRRRLQMQSERPRSQWLYAGTMDCLRKIVKDEGFYALYKGAGANAIRIVGAALVLVLYGEIKKMMGYKEGLGGDTAGC